MKKWIIMMLALALVLSMVGCGMTPETPAKDTAEEVSDSAEQPKEEQQTPVEEQTPVVKEDPETAEQVEETPEEPEDTAEPETPVDESTGPDMAEIAALLMELDMPEMISLDSILMLDYCGIEQGDVKQAFVAICADSLRTDELWLIEAVDEAAADRLVALADFRLQMKGEESITYSPEQYEVVQQAEVIRHGCYVAMLVSPNADELAALYNQLIGQ